MYGYQGRFLKVNLSARKIEDMPLSDTDTRQFIGGASLGARLIYEHVKPDMDPLGADSPLVFSTGPLTGTTIPMVSRYAVCGISPKTGLWGEATSGGVFPFRLKGSGYDGLFITGQADKPVTLHISKGSARIEDATHLWGKDTYETQKLLRDDLDDEGLSVACIGLPGEKMSPFSCIMNDEGRAAARCGLGALMGSKKLKAVAVSGNSKPESADTEKLRALSRKAQTAIKGNLLSVAFKEYGTNMYMDMGMILGDVPAKYFTKSVFQVEKVSGQALRQAYAVESYACRGCPIGCGREVKDFRPDMPSIDGPEYETVGAFGPLCMNTDLDTIIQANHLCNVHGLDTIATGVSIAYAMYLFERGILTREQAGMDISWGDGDSIIKLVEMIIKGEGIGNLLAKGTIGMARELGRDEEEAAQIKGMEMPMHDARASHGLAISYATGPRGACHLKGDYYNVDMGGGSPEINVMPGDRLSSENKAASAANYQSLKDIYDALTLCKFSPLPVPDIVDILNSITGWNISPMDLLAIGDRSVNIKRAINNKLGMTGDADRLPKICMDYLTEGSTAGQAPDMDRMLKEYYQHRQWDPETGKPTKEKLIELDLKQAARELYS